MSTKQTLPLIPNGRWAIARTVATGEVIGIVQNRPLNSDKELVLVLQRLNLPNTDSVLEEFFPKNKNGDRCPNFALMSLWYDLSPATWADSTGKV